MKARRAISGNQEVVIEVPAAMMITEETAMEGLGEMGGMLKGMLQDMLAWEQRNPSFVELGDALIALRLMFEKAVGEGSALKPYVDMLPGNLDTIPLFWSVEERERLLRGTMILRDTQNLSDSIDAQYGMLYDLVIGTFPEIFPQEYFSLEQYRLHIALSISRSYSLEGLKGTFNLSAIPCLTNSSLWSSAAQNAQYFEGLPTAWPVR